jgi:ParB-like chromosome segregation protein Spo0J
MRIEQRALDTIFPYARNPRKNQQAIPKVKASLKEFGWRQPIVVDSDGVIIVGHTRYLAALELGLTEAPVHVAENLTPSQVKAYRLADNRTNQEAMWDDELLKLEIEDLKELDFDLKLTGFDDHELSIPTFEPGSIKDQGILDSLSPKIVNCPHCGKEFDLREQG